MRILFKFPSRSRKEKFFSVLDNITALVRSDDYIIQATLDIDDPTMANQEVRDALKSYPKVKPYWGSATSKIHAINRDMEFAGAWDILVLVSDDFVFLEEGFDLRIIRDMQEHFPDTDGCLMYHDSTAKGHAQMTMQIEGRKYHERKRYIYYAGYLSVYADDEETRRAKDAGKLAIFPNRIFRHDHHLFNMSKADELNLKNDSTEMYEYDRNVFLQRNPTLLLNYATRGRPGLFFETLDNIEATISTTHYKVLVKIDTDDALMNTPEVSDKLAKYKNVSVFRIPPSNKIGAINSMIQYAGDWSWMANISDDMKFIVKGWDAKMLSEIKLKWGNSLDFFAHFPDGYVNEKLPTMSIIGRQYYQRDHYVYHSSYRSVSSDAEAMFVSMMRGCHHYFPTVYFNHVHPANCRFESDKTYRDNDKYGAEDTENYFTRRARLFDEPSYVMLPFNPLIRE